jgi:uncharacterized protein YceK
MTVRVLGKIIISGCMRIGYMIYPKNVVSIGSVNGSSIIDTVALPYCVITPSGEAMCGV